MANESRTRRARHTRTPRAAKLVVLGVLTVVLVSGCSAQDVLMLGWPDGITPQAERMRQLWIGSVIAAAVVGVIVWAAILWPVIAHRKSSERLPRQFQYNLVLDVGLTVLPVIMVLVLFYFTATTDAYIDRQSEDPDVTIDVVAFQWNWEFQYADEQLPQAEPGGQQVVTTTGTSTVIPLLVLPKGQSIQYRLRSKDVIHSFYVPAFHFKRDVFPNPGKNSTDNVFENSIDQTGSFVGRCAELCGAYHSTMNFEVRALERADYRSYVDLRKQQNPATGKRYTAGEALQELDCGELCAPRATTTEPLPEKRDINNPIAN